MDRKEAVKVATLLLAAQQCCVKCTIDLIKMATEQFPQFDWLELFDEAEPEQHWYERITEEEGWRP